MMVGNNGISSSNIEDNVQSSSYRQTNTEGPKKPLLNERPTIENKLETSKESLTGQDAEGKKKALLQVLEKEDNKIQGKTTSLEFAMHESTKQIMVKVIDNNTHEVVKEIPSEKILNMIAKMMELAGLFVDEKR